MGVAGLTTFLREGRSSLSTVNHATGVINDSLADGQLDGQYTEPQGEWTSLVVDAWSCVSESHPDLLTGQADSVDCMSS